MIYTRPDRRVLDDSCPADPENTHSPVSAGWREYACERCGHPAVYATSTERWYVLRPFLILEEEF